MSASAQNTAIKRLSVLIPVYNSQATIGPLVDRLVDVLGSEFASLEIMLVNDGSVDKSHAACVETAERHQSVVKYIRLARNFGEHNAVLCGLRHVTGECVAIVDDDFQNPPEEIVPLVRKLEQGYDVVYSYYEAKRHHWFRNLGSKFADRIATWLLRKPRGLYLSSFKVLNAFLVGKVVEYEGPFPYIDGLILRSTDAIGQQLCKHEGRKVGRSNYTLRRLISLWLNMFTGFSISPLRVASLLGMVMSLVSFGLGAFFIADRLTGGVFGEQHIPPGWASLIVCVTFFAGLQLCVLGLLGEYLGRLFLTANKAPQFVVRDTVGVDDA